MLKFRAISFTLLLGLLAATIFWRYGGLLFFALAIPVAVALVLEILRMLAKAGMPGNRGFAVILVGYAAGLALVSWILMRRIDYRQVINIMELLWYLPVPIGAAAAWLMILFARDRQARLRELLAAGGAAAFTLALILPLISIYWASGRLFCYFILVTKAGDTGGYIAGKLTGMRRGGNHKVAPSISPAKSWEGVAGGLILSIGVSLLLVGCEWVILPWWTAVIFGVILYIGGFAGDLSESALKRACGVKDAGHWIPGMGGVFDVLDSFIYNGIVFWVIWKVISLAGIV